MNAVWLVGAVALLGACGEDEPPRGPVIPVVTNGSTTLDINNDGHADFAAAKRVPGGAANYGIYVVLGGPAGLDDANPIFLNLRRPGFTEGEFGVYLDWIGDLDGDGFADLAATEQLADRSTRVLVYRGSAAGPSEEPVILEQALAGAPAPYGAKAGRIGDFNGDGIVDMFVHRAMNEIAIHYGGPGAPHATPDLVFDVRALGADFPLPPNRLDSSEDRFEVVNPAGDVDGDGKDDLLVWFHNRATEYPRERRYVLHGGGGWSLAYETLADLANADATDAHIQMLIRGLGDFDGNDFADLLVETEVNESALMYYAGGPNGYASIEKRPQRDGNGTIVFSGHYPQAIGDVNADGYDDVSLQDPAGDRFAFVFFGGPEGLAKTPSQSLRVPEEDRLRYQNTELTSYGKHATALGDIDGDGFGDVAFRANPNDPGGDAAYVLYGGLRGLDESRYQIVLLEGFVMFPED